MVLSKATEMLQIDFDIKLKRQLINQMLKEIKSIRMRYEKNKKEIESHKQLPCLYSEIREVINEVDEDLKKFFIVEMPDRKLCFVPCGLIPSQDVKPGQPVAVKMDSYNILEEIPRSSDIKIISKGQMDNLEKLSDVGGLSDQINELKEVLSSVFLGGFDIGISLPKRILLYGPPGNGKTLIARASIPATASFINISGPQLLLKHIGEGAKLVREVFNVARDTAPAIVFIDEIDAVGKKRSDSRESGNQEVQRTLIELLFQLDNIDQHEKVVVIAATNRVDLLDPALLRSGRFDKKIEIRAPSEEERVEILRIHLKRTRLSSSVSLRQLGKLTVGLSGAECRAVCSEAAMLALKQDKKYLVENDFINAIDDLRGKKKKNLEIYA